VLIADYWLVRKTSLALEDLYLPDGMYRYHAGWNWKAVVATLAGCALAWGGLVFPLLKPLYSYAWFVGFFAAGLLYWALSPRARSGPVAEALPRPSGAA
jgi:NCS1 family nucleobase:cation symporter-1